LLVVEVKKSTSTASAKKEFQKLEAFMKQLNYEYAAFVFLEMGPDPNYRMEWKRKSS